MTGPERSNGPPSDSGSDRRPDATDPRRVESLAVRTDDVVDALESNARGRSRIVLRVTPPFSGRMRARLHDAKAVDGASAAREERGREAVEGSETDGARPIHLAPERFVADPPPYPSVDETEDALRASETPYSRERHREWQQSAVDAWRLAVRERLVEAVELETGAERRVASVAYLG